jgi:predicted phosphodiesterase
MKNGLAVQFSKSHTSLLPPNSARNTVRLLLKLNIPSVRGNHDYYITRNYLEVFEPESQDYLNNLPLYLDILFGPLKIRIYHATPRSLDQFIPYNATKEMYDSLFGDVKTDIIVLGHTHWHYIKRFGEIQYINPGSLGMPAERSTFCILHNRGNSEFIFLH